MTATVGLPCHGEDQLHLLRRQVDVLSGMPSFIPASEQPLGGVSLGEATFGAVGSAAPTKKACPRRAGKQAIVELCGGLQSDYINIMTDALSARLQFSVLASKKGTTWHVYLAWPDCPPEHVQDFETEAEARSWINKQSEHWLRKRLDR